MIPALRAKFLLAAGLALAALVQAAPATAQSTRDQIRQIESEYARTHDGRTIPDAQLEYYLDRLDAGWSWDRVRDDIDATGTWRPAQGWTARQVICSSIGSRYAECPVPFRGNAVLLEQISSSACVEGRSWGLKPGVVWVDRGCRARFGITRDRVAHVRSIDCASYRGRYRECPTGIRGQVYLSQPLAGSRACIEGRTWGQSPGKVWVRKNCRATFASEGRPGPRDDVGSWTRRPNYAVTCVSPVTGRNTCSWDDRYGSPVLIQQISNTQCVEGRDWGYTVGGGVWVSSGCRATFGYSGASYADYGYRPISTSSTTFVRDPNYSVTCSSTSSGRTVCDWDYRYGDPFLRERLSGSCIEGRDWGYTRDGGVWVTSDCRAVFGYR
jgi:hypothetical protein